MIVRGRKLVVVRRAGDKEATTLQVGQSINGWTIEDIRSHTVSLVSGDARQTLRLADDKNSSSEP
jgi:hypothetical protein